MRAIHGLALIGLSLTAACAPEYDPMVFSVSQNRIIANGVIDARTLRAFKSALDGDGPVDTLVLQYIEGSADDEANLEFARIVREMGLSTLVPADGLVASGGTDLFLAGAERILEPGACVGVHSWGYGTFSADELPRSDPQHQDYLDYYDDIGIDQEFYWFTLESAPADGVHWMTRDEAARFDMTTGPTPRLGPPEICNMR